MANEDPGVDFEDWPLGGEGPGTDSVLVRGPAMTGKFEILVSALAALGDRSILVSTSKRAEQARQSFSRFGPADHLAVVDCATRVQGESPEETDGVRYAGSPQNLTEVGVKFTGFVDQFQNESHEEVTVGVHSLSELLMYWDAERIYQFTRVLLSQTAELGWTTFAVVDDSAADEQTVTTLIQPFDLVVETRRGEPGRQYRVRSRGDDGVDWTGF